MKILILLFCFATTILIGQQTKNKQVVDTLFIFGKKYPLLKTTNYFTKVFDFPFAVFTSQYQGTSMRFQYESVIREDCLLTFDFDECGNEIEILLCVGKEHDTFSFNNFVDSIRVDIDSFEYDNIKIKTGTTWKEINKLQYQAIYDSTFLTLQINGNCLDRQSLGKHLCIVKKNPKLILLNTLFYVDEKRRVSYYLPCEFIIIPK